MATAAAAASTSTAPTPTEVIHRFFPNFSEEVVVNLTYPPYLGGEQKLVSVISRKVQSVIDLLNKYGPFVVQAYIGSLFYSTDPFAVTNPPEELGEAESTTKAFP